MRTIDRKHLVPRRFTTTALGATIFLTACATPHVPQQTAQVTPAMAPGQFLVRLDNTTQVFDSARLATLPRESLTVEEGNRSRTYDGVRLGEVLRILNVPQGKGLGKAWMSKVLLARASDGYLVAFALPELDPAFSNAPIFLVDRVDGAPISGADGPFKIIAPNESRRARWVRGVVDLSVVQVPSP